MVTWPPKLSGVNAAMVKHVFAVGKRKRSALNLTLSVNVPFKVPEKLDEI